MVKHNYGSCAACHVDPSGGGQLTPYGRAQADVLVQWKTDRPPPDKEQEVPPSANFLWFWELPDFVNLSGNLRGGPMVTVGPTRVIPLIMSADLAATFNVGRFVFHGTGGYGLRNDVAPAIVAPFCDPLKLPTAANGQCGSSFVAREYWAGVKFADDAVMLRAGRLNLPFGLRNIEHTSWVRSETRTDTNVQQQLGVSLAYNTETLRGELMGIAGNFQLGPDAFRERGYSAYAEYALTPSAYLGLSSLVTHALVGLQSTFPTTRHAHGFFARWAPTPSLALLAEVDLLAWVAPPRKDRRGYAAMLQGDLEVMTGLHLLALVEGASRGDGTGTSLGFWGSVVWYPLPHLEVRLDNIARNSGLDPLSGQVTAFKYTFLAQFHVFL
jgi:hypothetical protein